MGMTVEIAENKGIAEMVGMKKRPRQRPFFLLNSADPSVKLSDGEP